MSACLSSKGGGWVAVVPSARCTYANRYTGGPCKRLVLDESLLLTGLVPAKRCSQLI